MRQHSSRKERNDSGKWITVAWGAALCVTAAILIAAAGYFSHINPQESLKGLCRSDGTLIYGADENAPPLRFVDQDGSYKGVVVDLMNQMSLELVVQIRTVPYPWTDALKALKNGDVDICDMFRSDERAKDYLFTDPVYNLRTALVTRSQDHLGPKDMGRMRIATQEGDYANDYLRQSDPGVRMVFVPAVEDGIALLAQGKVDGVIGDEPVVSYNRKKWEEQGGFKLNNEVLYEKEVVLAVNPAKEELIPILNRAIARIKKNGQLEQIQQKWFGISTPLLKTNPAAQIWKALWAPLLAGLLILLLFVLNNVSLKRQVKNRTRELENSRNELQKIFDGITEYIAMVDQEKVIVNANQGLAVRAGKKAEQVMNRPCGELLGKFCGSCQQCVVDQCRREGGMVKREISMEHELYEMAAYPLADMERGALVTLRDVTMERIRRKQLLQSSKMMAVGELAAGMAHEIRNPLGIIRTQSYLLREGLDTEDTDSQRSLDLIDSNVKRAGTIIDNVMKFWRESDEQPQRVNLLESMQSILILQGDSIRKKRITAQIDCSEELWIHYSPEAFKHIFLNLTSNAVDAMEEGGTLALSAALAGRQLEIICADNGSGIEEDHLEHLFNPFFTTKEPGKGTGLGLFIVYSEVEKLMGTITVESKPKTGTRFCISIPAQEGEKKPCPKKKKD